MVVVLTVQIFAQHGRALHMEYFFVWTAARATDEWEVSFVELIYQKSTFTMKIVPFTSLTPNLILI